MAFLASLAVVGCSGAGPAETAAVTPDIPEVIFSVANADRFATAADIEITVNGRPLIYGSFSRSPAGKYVYFSSRVPEKKMAIRVVSRSGDSVVEARRTVIVEDRVWVVVTRLERDGVSEMEISVSYEKPMESPPEFSDQ